ncbi:L-serine dehydratase [Arthrobacter sp. Hiyo8]|nr:L-serine dehydratase [Arthrobacter sp. Hiyo8]
MALSVLDLFSIGIGPSSSHTVGPMRAAKQFTDGLESSGQLAATVRVQAELFGSLGATGRGHGSDKAVVLGLQGQSPETVDTSTADDQVAAAALDAELRIAGHHRVDFNWDEDVVLHRRKSLPAHPNGMTFRALDHTGEVLRERSYYSIGGGFVVDGDASGNDKVVADSTVLPYPFSTADELLAICAREGMSISDVMLANELVWRSEAELRERLLQIWAVMRECVDNGCAAEGILPGGLNVRRRAPSLFKSLKATDAGLQGSSSADPLLAMEWVNLFALAVNEENAAGGRIVTAPPTVRRALFRRYCTITRNSCRAPTTTAWSASCSRRPPSGSCSRSTPPFPAPKSAARVKWAQPVRWLPLVCARSLEALPNKWRTPRKWASNTTLASRAIP